MFLYSVMSLSIRALLAILRRLLTCAAEDPCAAVECEYTEVIPEAAYAIHSHGAGIFKNACARISISLTSTNQGEK